MFVQIPLSPPKSTDENQCSFCVLWHIFMSCTYYVSREGEDMKINFRVRAKNPYFWMGIFGVILTSMGIEPETLTSWQTLCFQLSQFISNPFRVGTAIVAVIGVICDPTTAGIGDSKRAMNYETPGKE